MASTEAGVQLSRLICLFLCKNFDKHACFISHWSIKLNKKGSELLLLVQIRLKIFLLLLQPLHRL
jgi:hypothetical protein